MRIVVDTNVFINGIFKNDTFCKAIFTLKSLNKVSFVMNKEMQNESIIIKIIRNSESFINS